MRCLSGGKYWLVLQPYVYLGDDLQITIPRGFVTDFASIPWFCRLLAQPASGKHRRAHPFHDYMYQTGMFTRKESDLYWKRIMLEEGTPEYKATLLYDGVRAGAGGVWRNYRKLDALTN